MATVGETFEAGLLIRLWCFRCFRGGMMSPQAMQRYWERELRTVQCPCAKCRRTDQTIALPARDSRNFAHAVEGSGASLAIERWFHSHRAKRKDR